MDARQDALRDLNEKLDGQLEAQASLKKEIEQLPDVISEYIKGIMT